jgi:XFP C-terminal domain
VEGTTTTPLDMAVLNDLDGFHLMADVVERALRRRRLSKLRLSAQLRRRQAASCLCNGSQIVAKVPATSLSVISRLGVLRSRAAS